MTRDCWNEFAASGKVSDYLKYREQECRKEQPLVLAGGVRHGTNACPDRHGALSNACR